MTGHNSEMIKDIKTIVQFLHVLILYVYPVATSNHWLSKVTKQIDSENSIKLSFCHMFFKLKSNKSQ